MRILVLGAAGMLGGKLVDRLVRDGCLGSQGISQLTLVDRVVAAPPGDPGFVVESTVADLAEPGAAGAIVAGRPDVIFHLAAVVSGEAEDDPEKGLVAEGEDPAYVMQQLGHTDPKMTLGLYAKALKSKRREPDRLSRRPG
jgi:nucleoside-diphosphate-sugar epimerase